MSQGMTARSEQEVVIDDTYLDNNSTDQSAVIDCVEMTPIEAFVPACRLIARSGANHRIHPKGLHIDQASGQSGDTASYANMNRALLTHQLGQNTVSRYACGVMQPESVRYIYPYNTTARGIHIHA